MGAGTIHARAARARLRGVESSSRMWSVKERRIEIVNRRARSALVQLVHGESRAWWKARLAREASRWLRSERSKRLKCR